MFSAAFARDALSGVRVLVVDDEPLLATTFCLVLQFAGASAQSAAHGRDALETLDRELFDVILCDTHMPVMDGRELIRELNRRNNPARILLFVNAADTTAMQQTEDLRIDGTLSKPMLPGELVAAIRNTLQMAPNQSSSR